MKTKNKILIGTLTASILGFFILLYVASTKLNKEEIKKFTILQTQKIFPNAEVSLGEIEINWGLNFTILVKKYSIHLKPMKTISQNNLDLASLDELVIKIPIMSLLTGQGLVEIKLDQPKINYLEEEAFANVKSGKDNWHYAMGDKKDEDETKSNQESNSSEQLKSIENSDFVNVLKKNKVDVKFSNVGVHYTLVDKKQGQIILDKFLIKGLSLDSKSAFEMASHFKFELKPNDLVSFDALWIGEFNLSDVLKNGEFNSSSIFKINNFAKTGLDLKLPELSTAIDFLRKKDGEITGKIALEFEGQNKISSSFKIGMVKEFKNIAIDLTLNDFSKFIKQDVVKFKNSKFSLTGDVQINEEKKISTDMIFNLSPSLEFNKDGISGTTSFSGEYKDSLVNLNIKTELMGGIVTTKIVNKFDLNEKFSMDTLNPIDIKIIVSGMSLKEEVIRKKIWEKKNTNTAESNETNSEEKTKSKVTAVPVSSPFKIPPVNVGIEWSNVNIANEDFQGKGKIAAKDQQVDVEFLNFKFGKGSGKLSQSLQMNSKQKKSKFSFDFLNLNFESFKAFLPPFLENFTGTMSGNAKGDAVIYNGQIPPAYNVAVKIEAKNGELKKVNISEYLNPLMAKIPFIKDQDKNQFLNINGHFDSFNLSGNFSESLYRITVLDFIGIQNKIKISGTGSLYPGLQSKEKSLLDLNITDSNGKLSELLNKNTGSKMLPVQLSGNGFALKPDIGFTLTKIAKGALKTKGEEKIKEIVQKNIDKIIPEKTKEKVKDLFNGLFKKR